MLGAIQILPMLDAAALSMRNTTSAQFVNSYSLYPLNLLQLVAPYMFRNRVILHYTHEFGIYVGAVPLMLILWLPGRTKHLGALRGLLWAGIALAALGVALSLGPLGLLYGLQQYLPLVGKFRCPCRYLVFAELAVSLLASLGLLLLLGQVRREQRATWLELAPIGGLAFVSAATAAVGMALRYVPDLAWVMASSYEILAGPLLFGIAALLFSLAARGWKIGMVGLILFTSIDLGVYGLTYWMLPWNIGRIDSYLKPAPEPPERSAAADVAGVTTAGCRQSRVFINDVTLTFSSCTQVDGYAQLMPARRLDYLRLASLQVAATDWVWKNRENADIAGLLDRGGDWLEVPGALPPVRLVSRAEPSQDPARDLAGVDWHNTVLTDEPMTLTPSPPGSARVIERRPGRIELSIDAPARQILAIAESYHPGWQAMVNGTPEAVFRVNGDFLGCLAGPGRQHVTLVFQPRSLHHGRLISLAAILICCGWAAWVLARSVHHARGQTDRPRESVVH